MSRKKSLMGRPPTLLTFRNKTLSIRGWADELGMKFSTIESRLRIGWSVERALTIPPRIVGKTRGVLAESRIWSAMRERCFNKKNPQYQNYGGRGIRVCKRWNDGRAMYGGTPGRRRSIGFENFLADMGPRPSKLHSLDRRDNDGNYDAKNCRWSTREEQGRNKRTNRTVTFRGETRCIADWSRHLGISSSVLFSRLANGWTIQRAFTTPTVVNQRRVAMLERDLAITKAKLARLVGRKEPSVFVRESNRLHRGLRLLLDVFGKTPEAIAETTGMTTRDVLRVEVEICALRRELDAHVRALGGALRVSIRNANGNGKDREI